MRLSLLSLRWQLSDKLHRPLDPGAQLLIILDALQLLVVSVQQHGERNV